MIYLENNSPSIALFQYHCPGVKAETSETYNSKTLGTPPPKKNYLPS